MKEIDLLFSMPMAQAIDAGIKTQTRRLIKVQPSKPDQKLLFCVDSTNRRHRDTHYWATVNGLNVGEPSKHFKCRYTVGGHIWVKETFAVAYQAEKGQLTCLIPTGEAAQKALRVVLYRAKHVIPDDVALTWKASIFMPRWASRFLLEITKVRWERVADISPADAVAEGVGASPRKAVGLYRMLWNQMHSEPKPIYRRDEEGQRFIDHYVSFPFDGESLVTEHKGREHVITANPSIWAIDFKKINQ